MDVHRSSDGSDTGALDEASLDEEPVDEGPLDVATADPDPLTQFARWFARAAALLPDPEAMALATADDRGRPSARMVLLKSWDERGFVFFTNYDGRKSHDLAANPEAALLFHWATLGRQVRIEGSVTRTSDAESDAYYATRDLGSRIGAYASHQSRPIADRSELDAKVAEWTSTLAGTDPPRPEWWGGWRVVPRSYEFWQQGTDRLHDRVRYDTAGEGWERQRLQP